MLNRRSDKVELLRIAEAVAIEKSIDIQMWDFTIRACTECK